MCNYNMDFFSLLTIQDGCTPVHHAAQNEKVDALDLLNAYGVDMNAVNDVCSMNILQFPVDYTMEI